MFAHLRVKIEAWRLRGALHRCVLCGVLGVANGTRAPGMHDAIAPMPTMFSYPTWPAPPPKKHGGRIYEKLALRKKNLLQGDLPPERTAKETGTIWKRITPGGKG